jgi:C-terminal processing protease CtpA/Prc
MEPSPTFRRAVLGAAGAALALLSACGSDRGGGGDGGPGAGGTTPTACSESARKQFTLDVARGWYLFPELLPATVDLADFDDAVQLLDHLTATARAQGKDRYFSYFTTRAADNAVLGEGQFNGFGFRLRTETGNRPFVTEVFESSPAAEAGLRRGDEIVAVDAGSGFVPVAELLADGSSISEELGPAEVGVRRGLRLTSGGVSREVAMTKRTVTIDPVSDLYGAKVLPRAGTTGVGYLNLRSFTSTADPQLRDAFAQFRASGVDDFIVDLRYNGGGLVSTSELLGDLLGGARAASDVQLRVEHNPGRAAENRTRRFLPTAQSVRPVRIAFLTTGATASASEITVNSMSPWVEVAIVGEDTLGKPVGQLAFDLGGSCDDRLRLVSFRTVNAQGQGNYYEGLAGILHFACAASDTLDRPLGDPTEGLTAAALHWLGTGACETVLTAAPAARQKPAGGVPSQGQPPVSAAEAWLPGVV